MFLILFSSSYHKLSWTAVEEQIKKDLIELARVWID